MGGKEKIEVKRQNMNNKLKNFMIGRYGIDELYKLLLIIYFISLLLF